MDYIELTKADFIGLAFWLIAMPLLAWANRAEKRRAAEAEKVQATQTVSA